jgi:uncharacterized protein YndB with AHSA1/START domain
MSKVAPFSISREFDAPVALMFEVYSTVEHLSKWLSPEGFETVKADLNFTPGGTYFYGIRGPGGFEMWGKQRFLEIVPGDKIVFIQSFSNPEGGMGRHPMDPNWPEELLATTRFEALGPNRTRVTVTWAPYESDAAGEAAFDSARGSMTGGFTGTFDKLEAYVAKLQAK